MKPRASNILIAAAFTGALAVLLWMNGREDSEAASSSLQQVAEVKKSRHRPLLPQSDQPPVAEPVPVRPRPAVKKPTPPAKKPAPDLEARRMAAARRYWEQQSLQFNRQKEQLDREQNPARRKSLIRSIARFVRTDTPSVLEWAMNIADPAERQAALEAINQNALSGIGARIEVDETGLPMIRDTTLLSAVESTGQVENGDYIVGMQGADGTSVSFEGLSAREVAQHLRGQPGTEITLLMKRTAANGAPSEFDVMVKRSMLVVQPPY